MWWFENGPHRLIGSGTVRMCGLVGGSVSLGLGFEVSDAQGRPSVALSLMPANPDVELSAPPPAPSLPVRHYAFCHDNNKPNLRTVSHTQ